MPYETTVHTMTSFYMLRVVWCYHVLKQFKKRRLALFSYRALCDAILLSNGSNEHTVSFRSSVLQFEKAQMTSCLALQPKKHASLYLKCLLACYNVRNQVCSFRVKSPLVTSVICCILRSIQVNQPKKIDKSDSFLPTQVSSYKTVFYFKSLLNN